MVMRLVVRRDGGGGMTLMMRQLVYAPEWLASQLASYVIAPASIADAALLTGFAIAGSAFIVAAFGWALSERERLQEKRRSAAAEQARARQTLMLRDALLAEAGTPIVVLDGESPEWLSFAGGAQILEQCLAASEGATLAAALAALSRDGTAFDLQVSRSQEWIEVRGRAIGSHAAVFLNPSAGLDYRAVLEMLPVPVWIRDKNLRLRWANDAFLAAAGAHTLEHAMASESELDRAERDLAIAARDATKPVSGKRYAVLEGVRRALSLKSHPLRGGLIVGTACDFTGEAEMRSRLNPDADGHVHALNQISTAVAIFGPDRRLTFSNREYARLWGLEKDWLAAHPTEGEILDRLRELRLLPEQSDFAAWKRDRLKLFENPRLAFEELWHLPNGTALRVVSRPRPSGGLLCLFEDVSERLRQEAAYNASVKVQQTTLDSLQEGVAIFGTDGRLRLHNSAFARHWGFTAAQLSGAPHLKALAESCSARLGGQPTWQVIISCVTSLSADALPDRVEMARPDGHTLSLGLARLPDGATLLTVADVTDHTPIASALRSASSASLVPESTRTQSAPVLPAKWRAS
jgi:PAS domain-containing protein